MLWKMGRPVKPLHSPHPRPVKGVLHMPSRLQPPTAVHRVLGDNTLWLSSLPEGRLLGVPRLLYLVSLQNCEFLKDRDRVFQHRYSGQVLG